MHCIFSKKEIKYSEGNEFGKKAEETHARISNISENEVLAQYEFMYYLSIFYRNSQDLNESRNTYPKPFT